MRFPARTLAVLSLSLSSLLISGCAADTTGPAGPGDGLPGLKADSPDSPALEVFETSESLFSGSLRGLLCEAILTTHDWTSITERDAFDGGCRGHAFTVTEMRKSTLFAHLDDGDPITMSMDVTVDDGIQSWDAKLQREWIPSAYRFQWTAEAPDPGSTRDDYLRELAQELGDWPEPSSDVQPISPSGVPARVLATAEERAATITADFQRDGASDSAGLGDEGYFEIYRDGETVGYIVPLGYRIDDPRFDGGGSFLYINLLAEIVLETEWWG